MPIKKVIKRQDTMPVKVWTDQIDFASENQLANIAALPFIHKHVAAMPDVHLGKGATVGSVVPTKGAIIPAAVGVDIGCVDADTEFLSPEGWVRIADYNGQPVMQFDPKVGIGEFVAPSRYVKEPCEEFYHIKTKYGVDQMLSGDHRVLFYRRTRAGDYAEHDIITAEELYEKHTAAKMGFRGRFETTFKPKLKTRLPYTNDELRVIVMSMADGTFPKNARRACVVQLKKERKIRRAELLLDKAGVPYVKKEYESGVIRFRFDVPLRDKSMAALWGGVA